MKKWARFSTDDVFVTVQGQHAHTPNEDAEILVIKTDSLEEAEKVSRALNEYLYSLEEGEQ